MVRIKGTIEGIERFKRSLLIRRSDCLKLWLNGDGNGCILIPFSKGGVQALAQVKLNGHDLGTSWQPPFRVNITGALQAGSNALEVRVANLWRNRMIGDAALPAAERLTWSSWVQFSPDTPLPRSGLIGPVILRTKELISLP